MSNPLLDKDFLKELDSLLSKETFAKVISLTFDENPIEEITGKITQGSISVDGTSAVRRTCSLTMIADSINIRDYYWGINTKVKVYIGVTNTINKKYDDIIWFPQGIYILTSFNTTYSTSGFTIALQGKDKMCMLNGDVGGSINALSYDFGTIDEVDENGTITNTLLPVNYIIREAVHEYAREPYHNIIINDLDECGLELLEYRGDAPLYFLINRDTEEVENMTLEGSKPYYYYDESNIRKEITLETIDEDKYDPLVDLDANSETKSTLEITTDKEDKWYTVAKITLGDTCGYRLTDLTYSGDLIASVGDSVTSVLDKIVSMLGEFEYFYDLDGRFVFQKKRTFINTSWNNIVNNQEEEYVTDAMYSSADSYSFERNTLVTSFLNTPSLTNLRNDFSIWGKKDNDVPVHIRYAIDHKPTTYCSITVLLDAVDLYNKKYSANAKPQKSSYFTTTKIDEDSDEYKALKKKYSSVYTGTDWREIVYRMSVDYLKWNHLDDFSARIITANGSLYPNGQTGYELYYTDMNSFWRDLYNPDVSPATEPDGSSYYYVWNKETNDYTAYPSSEVTKKRIVPAEVFYEYNTGSGKYTEYSTFIEFNDSKEYYTYDSTTNTYTKYNTYEFDYESHSTYYYNDNFNLTTHWTNDLEHPETLNFWFDFLDTAGELDLFSVPSVGSRPKATNDDDVTAIYFRNTPKVIFVNSSNWNNERINKAGYKYIEFPSYLENFFYISALGKSANDVLEELLYNYSYCIENITISSLPIYHLNPNTRIFINDKNSNISGEYIVSKFTIPLSYNGTMSITATRAAERIN